MKCVSHLQGFDWECQTPEECKSENSSNSDNSSFASSILGGDGDVSDLDGDISSDSDGAEFSDGDEVEIKTYKDDSALVDQQSTGRKRAAKMYPMDGTQLCEWANKKNCGGGKFPITGCLAGLQQARHHGPDKNTLNNEKGNVHRICHVCHNRWHTLNDEGYVWGGLHEPHSPIEATVLDVAANEEFWEGRKLVKAKD